MLISAGLAFAALWITTHVFWFFFSLMGGAMMNDGGRATSDQHGLFLGLMLAGQVLTNLAVAPGFLAFFWQRFRKRLIISFAVLFLGGALMQVAAFFWFSNYALSHS